MVNPSLEWIGRGDLSKLTSTILSKLLLLKKVPGRSKFTRKADKVEALEGLTTLFDLELIDKNDYLPQIK